MPLVRTAPVPMYLLARAVRANAITVVATGEGADELFWGYELFKEVALRELAEQDPERASALLDGLYDYLGPSAARRGPAWKRFILETGAGNDPLGSHLTRAHATSAVKAFYSDEIKESLGADASLQRLRSELPSANGSWGRLERASWLEVTTLLEPYLLAAQGDRVAMGNGVEGRYPFLDHRVFDCASRLPRSMKLDGMRDKAILRDLADRLLPASIADRTKQPYRAPGIAPFFGAQAPDWVEEVVSPAALEASGLWDPARVEGLLRRCRDGRATGPREEMAFVGVMTSQLWHQAFMDSSRRWPEETAEPRVRIDRSSPTTQRQGAGI
jgi:asparagine synthase (glutamine-hydrolysing)